MNTMRSNRGFTLIELLVVVAIIGLLASIVIASLNTARMKGRDARRVADIKQISLALEMYNDANSQYATTSATSSLGSYIAIVPTDPKSGSAYSYTGLLGTQTSNCGSYHLGATLEQTGSSVLSSAAGKQSGGTYPAQDGTITCNGTTGTDFNGGGQVFDVRP